MRNISETAPWRRRAAGAAVLVAGALAVASCGASQPEARAPAAAAAGGSPPVAAADARPRIVILGDSLTAGLGLNPDEAYPALLQAKVDHAHLDYEVINAGVSGDTSAGGLRRLDWALDGDVRVLVVELGANDGLRGVPVDELRANLSTIIETAQARGVRVVLAGMEAPPNYGPDFTQAFHRIYPDLARQYGVALVPFLLDGVAGDPALNQADGIHPTARGAVIVADNMWAVLGPIVASPGSQRPA